MSEIELDANLDALMAGAVFEQVARGRWESALADQRWATYPDGSRTLLVALGDNDDSPWVAFYQVPSTYRFEAHAHRSHYMSYIVSGSVRVGRTWYRAGDIRIQEEGSVYGPEEAGPEGCTMINIFARRRGISPALLPDGRFYVDPFTVPAHITAARVHDPFTPGRGED